jgi:hypothetical protein
MSGKGKAVLASIAAMILVGCASGGGGGGSEPRPTQPPAPSAAQSASDCGTVNGYPVQCIPYLPFGGARSAPPSPQLPSYSTKFENWWAPASQWKQGPLLSVSELPQSTAGRIAEVNVRYDAVGNLTHFSAADYGAGTIHFYYRAGTLARLGQPAIDVGTDGSVPWGYPTEGVAKTPFLDLHANVVALVANPHGTDWNYQSFGVWNRNSWSGGRIGATSFGAATPASAVPTTGTATFIGKLAGFYVSPTGQGSAAAAELSVAANFSSRSLTLASSGTMIEVGKATAAPNLNLGGTLTYATGTNAFAGSLANAGGTLGGRSTGQFYGPAAQELGGVFNLKSPTTAEAFVGAYGAKR